MRQHLVLLSALLLSATVVAQPKYEATDKGDYIEITQQGGRTLGYSQNSGVKILEVEGYAFKDLNRNGKLDKYEDWRLSSAERAKDLASQLSLEENGVKSNTMYSVEKNQLLVPLQCFL